MGLKLDELVKTINKEAKEEIITEGLSGFQYRRIPFTSPRMNYCTFGGVPMNVITEFYGEEHGGKTSSALDIVANYQIMEDAKDVLYIDAENTLDVEWARKFGVDVDKMYILQPKEQSAEEIFQIIYDAVNTGEVGLWVLDSIGALVSSQELENTMDEKTYGGIAKVLTLFGKKIVMAMKRNNCTGIGINQIREDLKSTWGGIKTPGGKGWKHLCAARFQFTRGSYIDKNGNELTRGAESPAGNIVLMSMTKNKTCPPTRRTGFYTINYEIGVDYLHDLVDVAIKYGIIEKKGAWFTIIDIETGEVLAEKMQGQAAVFKRLETEDDLMERVQELVELAMNGQISAGN